MIIKKKILLSVLVFIIVSLIFYIKKMPYIIQANVFFMLNNEALGNTAKLLSEHKEIIVLKRKTIDGLIFTNNEDKEGIISNYEFENYGDIINDLTLSPIRRMPEKISFFLGSKRKFNTTFNISYDYFFDKKNIKIDCNRNYELQQHGVCTYLLDTHWVLRYEWISI